MQSSISHINRMVMSTLTEIISLVTEGTLESDGGSMGNPSDSVIVLLRVAANSWRTALLITSTKPEAQGGLWFSSLMT